MMDGVEYGGAEYGKLSQVERSNLEAPLSTDPAYYENMIAISSRRERAMENKPTRADHIMKHVSELDLAIHDREISSFEDVLPVLGSIVESVGEDVIKTRDASNGNLLCFDPETRVYVVVKDRRDENRNRRRRHRQPPPAYIVTSYVVDGDEDNALNYLRKKANKYIH